MEDVVSVSHYKQVTSNYIREAGKKEEPFEWIKVCCYSYSYYYTHILCFAFSLHLLLFLLHNTTTTTTRLDEMRVLCVQDRKWTEFFTASNRLVFKCQKNYEKNHKMRILRLSMFKSAYIVSHFNVNAFINEENAPQDTVSLSSSVMIDAFEKIIMDQATLHANAAGEFDLNTLNKDDVLDFNEKLKAHSLVSYNLASSTSKALYPYYMRLLSTLNAMESVANIKHFEEMPMLVQSLKFTYETVLRNFKRTFSGIRMKDANYTGDISPESIDSTVSSMLKTRYDWDLHYSLTEFVYYNAAAATTTTNKNNNDRPFFDKFSERRCLGIDLFNQTTALVVEMIKTELLHQVDAKNSIICYFKMLENGARVGEIAQQVNHRSTNYYSLLYTSVVDKWCSGRVSWDETIRILDAYIDKMQLFYSESRRLWDNERVNLVAKYPDTVSAFIKGIQILTTIQRMARISKLNRYAATTIAVQGNNHVIYKTLREIYRKRGGICLVYPKRTQTALIEIAQLDPSLKQNIAEKKKGALFVWHGMFITHVVFRRTLPPLDRFNCPETLILEGYELSLLQKDIWSFCSDAALLLLSSPAELEFRLLRFFAMASMQITSRKLPPALEKMQDIADKIVVRLTSIIRVNRGIHHPLYKSLIVGIYRLSLLQYEFHRIE